MSEARFPLEEREWKGIHSRKKPFTIEYRLRPEKESIGSLFANRRNWRVYSHYATKQARYQALRDLRRKATLFEYRKGSDKNSRSKVFAARN